MVNVMGQFIIALLITTVAIEVIYSTVHSSLERCTMGYKWVQWVKYFIVTEIGNIKVE